jgi:hypothetical protein
VRGKIDTTISALANVESDRAKNRINDEYELLMDEEAEILSLINGCEQTLENETDYKLIGDKTMKALHEYIDIIKLNISPEKAREIGHLLFGRIVLSRDTFSLGINSRVGEELKEIHITYKSHNQKVRADIRSAPPTGLNRFRRKTFQYVSMV